MSWRNPLLLPLQLAGAIRRPFKNSWQKNLSEPTVYEPLFSSPPRGSACPLSPLLITDQFSHNLVFLQFTAVGALCSAASRVLLSPPQFSKLHRLVLIFLTAQLVIQLFVAEPAGLLSHMSMSHGMTRQGWTGHSTSGFAMGVLWHSGEALLFVEGCTPVVMSSLFLNTRVFS